MVLVEKWPVFQLFFSAIQAKKMSFTIFQNVNPSFQAIKTRSSESRKIEIFPKGLTHGFDAKMAIFPSFSFRQYRPDKCVLRYSRTKRTTFQAKKTTSSKGRKIEIFRKGLTHGFGRIISIFQTFFQGIQPRKMCYTIFQKKKIVFLDYKKNKFKKVEKLRFFQRG